MKQADPHTAFTMTALRRLVKTGVLPVIPIGNKRLIDLDKLPEQLLAIPMEIPEPVKLGVRAVKL